MDKSLIYEYTTLTADECADLLIDNAKAYVMQTTMGDSWAVDQFMANSLFWDWWSYQWHQRDKRFIEWLESMPLADIHVLHAEHIYEQIKNCYLYEHNPEALLEIGIKPHRILEEKIYKTMVTGLIKEVKHG